MESIDLILHYAIFCLEGPHQSIHRKGEIKCQTFIQIACRQERRQERLELGLRLNTEQDIKKTLVYQVAQERFIIIFLAFPNFLVRNSLEQKTPYLVVSATIVSPGYFSQAVFFYVLKCHLRIFISGM